MRRLRTSILTLAVAAMPFAPAAADHTPDLEGCPIHVSDASAANPHLADPAGDWKGMATGRADGTTPYGDVYREQADVLRGWIARGADGALSANITVADLRGALQPNTVFYFIWNYDGSNATQRTRFVSAKLKGYGVDFTYGYQGAPNAAGVRSFVTEGTTTGRIIDGAPGTVSMDIPREGTTASGAPVADWGAPEGILTDLKMESRVLLGSPEPLPPNPVARSGLVGVADDGADGDRFCNALVP